MDHIEDSIMVNGERYIRASIVLGALANLSHTLDYNDVALEEIDATARDLGLITDGSDDIIESIYGKVDEE